MVSTVKFVWLFTVVILTTCPVDSTQTSPTATVNEGELLITTVVELVPAAIVLEAS
jgi:hypothetical protein